MLSVAHPEVLAHDWLPPYPRGREVELREVVRRLDAPRPSAPPPWLVAVAGPSGSGTSTVARRAAREVVDRLRQDGATVPPRILAVRVGLLRGTHGVAASLLQRFDEGFDGRGFPAAEILAGVLRRIRREGRPTVLVLDDVGVGGPDVAPIVRAFADPDRFLPEGESGLPPSWTIVAGTVAGLEVAAAAVGPRAPLRPFLRLDPYSSELLESIVRDRVERALGHPAPNGFVEGLVRRAVEDGGGARRALDLARRGLFGAARTGPAGRLAPDGTVRVEGRVVRAIGEAIRGRWAARVGDVRREEARLAEAEGSLPLPTTTLWRRIVRLERAGYVCREVRTGGPGGTTSILKVLTPIDEWVTSPSRSGILRGSASPRATGEGREEGPVRSWSAAVRPFG